LSGGRGGGGTKGKIWEQKKKKKKKKKVQHGQSQTMMGVAGGKNAPRVDEPRKMQAGQ